MKPKYPLTTLLFLQAAFACYLNLAAFNFPFLSHATANAQELLSPSETQLILEKVELDTLRLSLGEGHPLVKSASIRVKALQDEIQASQKRVVDPKAMPPNPYLLQQLAIEKAKYEELLTHIGSSHPQSKNQAIIIKDLETQIAETAKLDDTRSADAISQLVSERSKLAELLRTLGASHPLVKSAQARIASIEKNNPPKVESPFPKPINKIVEGQIAIEEKKLAELRETHGPDHPLVKRPLLRIRLLQASLRDPSPFLNAESGVTNDASRDPSSIPFQKNVHNIDRMLCQRVLRELESVKREYPNDPSRWEEVQQKLEMVALDAIASRKALLEAELQSVRQLAEKMERQIKESEKDPRSEIQKLIQELR